MQNKNSQITEFHCHGDGIGDKQSMMPTSSDKKLFPDTQNNDIRHSAAKGVGNIQWSVENRATTVIMGYSETMIPPHFYLIFLVFSYSWDKIFVVWVKSMFFFSTKIS